MLGEDLQVFSEPGLTRIAARGEVRSAHGVMKPARSWVAADENRDLSSRIRGFGRIF